MRLRVRCKNLPSLGRGDDTIGNPHRIQFHQFELFELLLLFKLDKQFPVEQFEATVSQSTVTSPPLTHAIADTDCGVVVALVSSTVRTRVVSVASLIAENNTL